MIESHCSQIRIKSQCRLDSRFTAEVSEANRGVGLASPEAMPPPPPPPSHRSLGVPRTISKALSLAGFAGPCRSAFLLPFGPHRHLPFAAYAKLSEPAHCFLSQAFIIVLQAPILTNSINAVACCHQHICWALLLHLCCSFQSQNAYFNSETSSLRWKSKLRNVWGQ